MKKQYDYIALGWFLFLVTLLVSVLSGCKTELVEPEEKPIFKLSGHTWQNHMDEVVDGVKHDFLPCNFDFNEFGSGTGTMIYNDFLINLAISNVTVSGNTVTFRAISETWSIKDIQFNGTINFVNEVDNPYEVHGHFHVNFVSGYTVTPKLFLLHLKQQDIKYLPKTLSHNQGGVR